MKPTRNNVFCPSANKPKILFEEKSKALNFIKFNHDEILDEAGKAPIRAYFCSACAGWHVTSKRIPISNRRKAAIMLKIAKQHLYEGRWSHCRRFLCYSELFMSLVKRNFTLSAEDVRLESEINNTIKKLRSIFINHLKNTGANSVNSISNFVPHLIHENENESFFAIDRGSIPGEDVERLISQHESIADEMVCKLNLHMLNIVDVVQGGDSKSLKGLYYESLKDLFDGDILDAWISGRRLFVLEKYKGKSVKNYLRPSHLDYWVKFNNRSIRFFAGMRRKYTCLIKNKIVA